MDLSQKDRFTMFSCCLRKEKYKENTIVPEKESLGSPRITAGFLDKFSREVIYCGGCKTPFHLGSCELKVHCNICNQFFHCKIAGECIGKDCKVQLEDGSFHRASYCVDCVAKVFGNKCLCKDCNKT